MVNYQESMLQCQRHHRRMLKLCLMCIIRLARSSCEWTNGVLSKGLQHGREVTWASSALSNWSICLVNWLFSTPPTISFPHLFLSTNSQSDYPPGLANNINRVADCLTVCTNMQLHTKLTYKLLCTFNAYCLPKYRYAPHTMQPTYMRRICETRTSTRLYHTTHPLQYIRTHTHPLRRLTAHLRICRSSVLLAELCAHSPSWATR